MHPRRSERNRELITNKSKMSKDQRPAQHVESKIKAKTSAVKKTENAQFPGLSLG